MLFEKHINLGDISNKSSKLSPIMQCINYSIDILLTEFCYCMLHNL
jgi:hypothetical protein